MSVIVFTENWDGKFKKLSFELVSYAADVAGMLGTDVTAVSLGKVDDDELKKLALYGASKIINIKNDILSCLDNQIYTKVISDLTEKEKSSLLVLSNNNTGKAIAPRLSVRLKAGLVSGIIGLPLSINPFIVRKRVFSGKAIARLEIKSPVKILTLAQNSYEVKKSERQAVIETITTELDSASVKTVINKVEKQTGRIILTDAEIVISGGRGMKSPSNWGPLEELAGVLGAALACSRPVSDEGWRPHEEHTGQTGKIIAPNLYIAFGISGAIQHLAGVSSSKYIVAINNDKNAPIFEAADYGIVGDAMKILPELINEIKSIKAQ
jgi:electron transfer flavoprotein alpha subunit